MLHNKNMQKILAQFVTSINVFVLRCNCEREGCFSAPCPYYEIASCRRSCPCRDRFVDTTHSWMLFEHLLSPVYCVSFSSGRKVNLLSLLNCQLKQNEDGQRCSGPISWGVQQHTHVNIQTHGLPSQCFFKSHCLRVSDNTQCWFLLAERFTTSHDTEKDKQHVVITAFLCAFASVCMFLIGFKVLVAKLDEMGRCGWPFRCWPVWRF